MTQDAMEMQVQDYLDDRMSDGERRAFESRLAADAGLARHVRELRAISQALGEDSPELPPGFHTRLRARFEAQHAPARRWFHPLSWETAGLVTAVAVAAVLFIPVLMEQQPGRPDSQILFEPSEKELRKSGTRDAVEEGRVEAIGSEVLELEESSAIDDEDANFAPSPESSPEPAVEPEAQLELQRRYESAKSTPAPPSSAKPKKSERGAPLQEAPAEPERSKRSRADDKGAAGAAEAPTDSASKSASGRVSVGEAKDEIRAQTEGFDDRSVAAGGVALTGGLVEAGEVVEIRSEEQWNRLVLEVGPAKRDALGAFDPVARLVLVGARETPVDCLRSVIVAVADGYEIRLVAAAVATTEPVHGCAFRLPADGRPIHVVGPAGAR